jgi:hypothetical protein
MFDQSQIVSFTQLNEFRHSKEVHPVQVLNVVVVFPANKFYGKIIYFPENVSFTSMRNLIDLIL